MKTCPQCSSLFTDDHFFCLNDGTMLTGAEAEQETVVSKRADILAAENVSPSGPAIICPSCGLENAADYKFCKTCGTALRADINSGEKKIFTPDSQINFHLPQNDPPRDVPQVQPINFAHVQPGPSPVFGETVAVQPSPSQFTPPGTGQNNTIPKSGTNKFLIGGISFLVVVLLIGGAWLLLREHPMSAKLNAAIGSNKLISPAGDNAYEYYQQMKKDGVNTEILKKFEDRLYPLLIEKPPEILKTVAEPGYTEKRVEEWQDAAKMLEWATEMRPADAALAAKASYCRGRVNYLNEQKDAAIENWKKAADLDKKWALPLNGIGLIYNERKNYEGAKPFLRQAIEREAAWPLPYNNLGTAFYYQKRYAEAKPFYEKAVELSPRWVRPHAWLGSIAMEFSDYSTAVAEFEKVFAPDAVGASELNMNTIREKMEEAKRKLAEQASASTFFGY